MPHTLGMQAAMQGATPGETLANNTYYGGGRELTKQSEGTSEAASRDAYDAYDRPRMYSMLREKNHHHEEECCVGRLHL